MLWILNILVTLLLRQSWIPSSVSVLMTGADPPLPCEMPEEFQLPLDRIEEVEESENWIPQKYLQIRHYVYKKANSLEQMTLTC